MTTLEHLQHLATAGTAALEHCPPTTKDLLGQLMQAHLTAIEAALAEPQPQTPADHA